MTPFTLISPLPSDCYDVPERLHELFKRCSSLQSDDHVSRTGLQPLLGVMSYVTACVRPARVFMSTLLHTHLNAVRLLHLYRGYSVEPFSSFAVTVTRKGLMRMLGTSSRQKHPITPNMLVSIRRSLDFTVPCHPALWALFTTAFFSFLRKSNLVAASAPSFNCDLHLSRRDIKFTDAGVLLRTKGSKTRQFNEGVHIIPLPSIPRSPLCPVSAIHHYFALVPAPPTAPFFCLPTDRRPGFNPLTASYFTTSLKRLIASLGLDPGNYSPHSFRRGGATYAYQAGVPEHLTKLHGHWRSDAYHYSCPLELKCRTLWLRAFLPILQALF